ncbi:diguanylate cyclase [Bacillus sp. EB01]|uniref:diguanylate cyclase n=1 Tax=Bacillus sp. EB01 TaxID=1347086 RepID=UPI0009DF3E88
MRQPALRIEKIVGDSSTVARYGGEEFDILLPDGTNQALLYCYLPKFPILEYQIIRVLYICPANGSSFL